MSTLFLIGRTILGGYHLLSGIIHFVGLNHYARYAKKKGVPLPRLSVIFTGLILIAGGLSIIFLRFFKEGLWLLIVFYFLANFLLHEFWREKGEKRVMEMGRFFNNIAMVGALLMLMMLTEMGGMP